MSFRRSPRVPARTFRPLVEQLEGRRLLTTFVVDNLTDSGPGSLRQAILDANGTSGADVIAFQVTGSVRLTSGALPALTDPVTLDGTTAPAFAGAPLVEVNANGFGGLSFNAGSAGSALQALAVINARGDGVTLNAGNITVTGNYIGLRLDGKTAAGNGGNGLTINSPSSGDLIGGPGGRRGAPSNVISGNRGNGIVLDGATSDTVQNNFIGTDATGTLARPNGGSGIVLTRGAGNNLIGGVESGEKPGTKPPDFTGARPPLGNVVSGNKGNGVLLTAGANSNFLEGNFVGTDISGVKALGNRLDGVVLDHAPGNTLAGTTATQDPFIYFNVVSGNAGNGLRITDSDNTTVQANFFGAGSDNRTPVGNGLNGVVVEGTSANTMFGGRIPLGNVVAANALNGVVVKDRVTGFTSFNTFCGAGAFVNYNNLGNGWDGFLITATGGNNLLLVNQVSSSGHNGVEITGNATGVQVTRTIFGPTINNDAILPNKAHGIEVGGNAHGNTIGGLPPPPYEITIGPHNAMSGNLGYGVAFTGCAHDNVLNYSDIGIDMLGNFQGGVLLGAGTHHNTVGSTDPGLPTVIGGNFGNGIDMVGTRGNTVVGTFIGVDSSLAAQPNRGDGLRLVKSSDNLIGGTAAGQGNTIADNGGSGVFVKSGERNAILGNSIYGNVGAGIRLGKGANDHQAAPVLTGVAGGSLSGTLVSTPRTTFTIQLFADGGKTYLGSVAVKTDRRGVATFTFAGLPAGADNFVATATDAEGNTSPFSLPLTV